MIFFLVMAFQFDQELLGLRAPYLPVLAWSRCTDTKTISFRKFLFGCCREPLHQGCRPLQALVQI